MQIVDSLSFVDIRLDFIWKPNLERATNITNSKFLELLQISNNKTQNYWNSNQNGYQMEMPTCACFTQFINGDVYARTIDVCAGMQRETILKLKCVETLLSSLL